MLILQKDNYYVYYYLKNVYFSCTYITCGHNEYNNFMIII